MCTLGQDSFNSRTLLNEYNLKGIWLLVSIRWRSFSEEETECDFSIVVKIDFLQLPAGMPEGKVYGQGFLLS